MVHFAEAKLEKCWQVISLGSPRPSWQSLGTNALGKGQRLPFGPLGSPVRKTFMVGPPFISFFCFCF